MVLLRRPTALVASLLAVASLLLTVVPPPADAAEIGGRPDRRVWDVVPRPGEVVSAGGIQLAGTIVAADGIRADSVQFVVDGEPVAATIADQNAVAIRATADVQLEAGEHLVELTSTDGAGNEVRRPWRFSTSDVGLGRLYGSTRYETAATIAANGREQAAAPAAVLARGDEYADALAGAPLAQSLDGPLLLSARDALSDEAASSLTDLVAPGGTVHLLGGTAALSSGVADAVRGLGFEVVRHQGTNRYETAVAIAEAMPDSTSAVVASGTGFPDALAAAPPAAITGQPILLSGADGLPEATAAALQGVEDVTLVGGAAVLSEQVQADADAAAGSIRRLAGEDRFATARAVANAFDLDTTELGLASGRDFADALAGAVNAAMLGTGILLVEPSRVPDQTAAALRELAPGALRVYGGAAAVDDSVANEARAVVDGQGARVVDERPASTAEITTLDAFTLTFGETVEMPSASFAVTVDGREIPIELASGDFDDTLVLTATGVPFDPEFNTPYEVRLVGEVNTPSGFTHVDRTWTYRKVSMTTGDTGGPVQRLQQRLLDLGYWLDSADGAYGSLTVQAVMAFQKYEGLPVSGSADDATLARLETAQRPVPADGGGYHAEIDKTRQVLMFAEGGRTTWTFNTSTGTEQYYEEDGGSGLADTPPGSFTVCREVDGLREADLGSLFRPKYFNCAQGIAIHGASNVPAYPASHGCVRVTNAAINFIWAQNMLEMGTRVLVYGRYPGT